MKFKTSLAILTMLATFAAAAVGQSTASLTGTITDSTGAVLPGAHVTVHSIATHEHARQISS